MDGEFELLVSLADALVDSKLCWETAALGGPLLSLASSVAFVDAALRGRSDVAAVDAVLESVGFVDAD